MSIGILLFSCLWVGMAVLTAEITFPGMFKIDDRMDGIDVVAVALGFCLFMFIWWLYLPIGLIGCIIDAFDRKEGSP